MRTIILAIAGAAVAALSLSHCPGGGEPNPPEATESPGGLRTVATPKPHPDLVPVRTSESHQSLTDQSEEEYRSEPEGTSRDSIYNTETVAALQEKGLSAVDIRLRLFSAKMARYSEWIEEARAANDTDKVRGLFDSCASNIAEVYLIATGRPGVPQSEADLMIEGLGSDWRGTVISLNDQVYALPFGEIPFVDIIKGCGAPRPTGSELMEPQLFDSLHSSVGRVEQLADSMTGGERLRYEDD